MKKQKVKFLIISDIHLSSPVSRSDKASEILNLYEPETIIINGDLIDSEHLTRLKKNDWKFLSNIRKLTKHHRVLLVKGNHDFNILDFLGELLGLDVVEHFSFTLDKKKYYVVHGDLFDNWISDRPIITEIASFIHLWFQKLGGRRQKIALFLKHASKKYLRCTDKVKQKSYEFCKKHGYDGLISGHTHFPEYEIKEDIEYWNSGCLSDADGKNSYIIINFDNKIEIKYV